MNTKGSLKEWIQVNSICINQIDELRQFAKHYTQTNEMNRKSVLLISLLSRCLINLTSIAILTKNIVESKGALNLKLSIGIILRNCYMDMLLALYLCDKDDNNIEEIAEVLNADYVNALFEEFEVYRDKVSALGFDDDMIEHMYAMAIEDSYFHYLEPRERIVEVKPGEERYIWKVAPKNQFRTLIPKEKAKLELTLKAIWEDLNSKKIYSNYANSLYAYYKYFSQYEHFSEAGYGNTIASSEDDNIDMVKAVKRLVEAVGLIKTYGLSVKG